MNKKIFLQLLCSEDSQKIAQALTKLENDQALLDFANTWFLNLIRTRLNDPSATLQDFGKVGFSKNEYKPFYLDNFDTEWFDFFQIPDETLRHVVDFYGSITGNFFDKKIYLEALSNVHSQDDLYNLDIRTAAAVNKGFLDIRKYCNTSKGNMTWFDHMICAPYVSGIYGLKFKSCDLSKMNESPYIDEFYFYVLAKAYDSIEIHNSSSGPCYFPQLLWGAKAGVNLHDFKDVIVKVPENPLKVFNSWTLTQELKDGKVEEHNFYEASWETYFKLKKKGNDLHRKDKYEEALEIYEEAASLQGTKEVYEAIYHCKRYLKQELLPTYEKLVQIDSKDLLILNNLSFQYYKKNRLEDALEVIEKATSPKFENNERYGLAWATKAEICFKLGKEEGLFDALNNCLMYGFDPLQCDPDIQTHYQNDPRYRAVMKMRNETKRNEAAWSDLNVNNIESYQAKRLLLEQHVMGILAELNKAQNFSDFVNCLVSFIENCESAFGDKCYITKRFNLTYSELVVEEFQINLLKEFKYPAEFIDWHKNYGHMSGIAGVFISNTSKVLQELKAEGQAVLKANGFLFITGDGGGNAFVYDINETPARIILMDHNVSYSLDDLREAYIDNYALEQDGDNWLNPKELDLSQVFTADNEFRLDSPYVKSILLEEGATLQSQINLLDFFKAQLIESLNDLQKMHSIEL